LIVPRDEFAVTTACDRDPPVSDTPIITDIPTTAAFMTPDKRDASRNNRYEIIYEIKQDVELLL